MKVAVYGTLKEGRGNHRLLDGLEKVKDDYLCCERINAGGFPIAHFRTAEDHLDKETFWLKCELYEIDTEARERHLDALEGVPSLYVKRYVKTKSGEDVLVYHYARDINNDMSKVSLVEGENFISYERL